MTKSDQYAPGALRLHELIAQLATDKCQTFCTPGSNDEKHAREILKDAQAALPSAVRFFIDDAVEIAPIPELFRLPFDTCWFEMPDPLNGNDIQYGSKVLGFLGHQARPIDDRMQHAFGTLRHGVLAQNMPNGILLTMFFKTSGWWSLCGAMQHYKDSDSWVGWLREDGFGGPRAAGNLDADFQHDLYRAPFYKLSSALSAINCTNVRRVEMSPPARLNAARQKRGKLPLYSFWTLRLDDRSASSGAHGARGPGVRLHLRRGHPREYKPGLYTWVQPHVVGDKQKGIVAKDYAKGGN